MSKVTDRDSARQSRELIVTSRRPWQFKIASTDGSYDHVLWWSEMLKDVVCESCYTRHGRRSQCWVRKRCLDFLRSEMSRRQAAAS